MSIEIDFDHSVTSELRDLVDREFSDLPVLIHLKSQPGIHFLNEQALVLFSMDWESLDEVVSTNLCHEVEAAFASCFANPLYDCISSSIHTPEALLKVILRFDQKEIDVLVYDAREDLISLFQGLVKLYGERTKLKGNRLYYRFQNGQLFIGTNVLSKDQND